jgi:hypothetical protein
VPPAIAVATVVIAADHCRCVGFVVVVVIVFVVDVVVIVIVVVVFIIVVFIVFVVLVILFAILVVVVVVFVVFVIVIVVVVFIIVYELLSPPPLCLRCRFYLIVVCAPGHRCCHRCRRRRLLSLSLSPTPPQLRRPSQGEIMRGGFKGEMRCGWMDVRYVFNSYVIPVH